MNDKDDQIKNKDSIINQENNKGNAKERKTLLSILRKENTNNSSNKNNKTLDIINYAELVEVAKIDLDPSLKERLIDKNPKNIFNIDDHDELEQLIDSHFILRNPIYYKNILLYFTLFTYPICLILIVESLYMIVNINNYFILYIWLSLLLSIFTFILIYKLRKDLKDKNMLSLINYDLPLLLLFILNVVLIVSYPALSEQFLNESIINKEKYIMFITVLLLVPFTFANYYITTLFGVYYNALDSIENKE